MRTKRRLMWTWTKLSKMSLRNTARLGRGISAACQQMEWYASPTYTFRYLRLTNRFLKGARRGTGVNFGRRARYIYTGAKRLKRAFVAQTEATSGLYILSYEKTSNSRTPQHRAKHNLPSPNLSSAPPPTLTALPTRPRSPPPPPQVLEALHAIRTTPYENSFLSRLNGLGAFPTRPAVHVDWEAKAPWTELMEDIRMHRRIKWCALPLLCGDILLMRDGQSRGRGRSAG